MNTSRAAREGRARWRGRDWSGAVCCAIAAVWTLLLLGRQFGRVNYTTQDRGRDLYVAWRVSLGELPYRDFDWPYGPLGPIYYGTWFRLHRPSMLVFEMAETFAIMLAGLGVYILCSKIAADTAEGAGRYAAGMAGLAGYFAWLLILPVHHEAHTGNHHLGAIFISIALMLALRSGAASNVSKRSVAAMGFALGLLACVKLNMGLAFAAAWGLLVALSAIATQRGERRQALEAAAAGAAVFIGVIIIIYAPLVVATPRGSLARCFPFAGGMHHDYGSAFTRILFDARELALRVKGGEWLKTSGFFFMHLRALSYAVALAACAAWAVREFIRRARNRKESEGTPIAYPIVILIFLLAAGHEFFLAGSWYATPYWAGPCVAAMVAALAGKAASAGAGRAGRAVAFALALAVAAAMIVGWEEVEIYLRQGEWIMVDHPRGGLMHLKLAGERDAWSETVAAASREIEALSERGEAVLAAPFDPIYLFMADRPQICRLVDFSGYQKVSPAEEEAIIALAEERGLRIVILSNNATGLAGERFGAPHCPVLAAYIDNTFRPYKTFGPADMPGRSHSFHGVTILVRK